MTESSSEIRDQRLSRPPEGSSPLTDPVSAQVFTAASDPVFRAVVGICGLRPWSPHAVPQAIAPAALLGSRRQLMTKYNLKDNQQAKVARRTLMLTVSGGRPGEIVLTARHGEEVERNDPRGNPGALSQLEINEHTVVRIEPRPGGRPFPHGTIASLELVTSRNANGDQDSIMVCDVEVSGAPFRDMVTINVSEDEKSLTVTALHPGDDPEVNDLAKMARAAARAYLGFDRLHEAVRVLVAVDMSASMAPALSDGSVGAALELIIGISQVIDSDRIPEVFLLTEQPEKLSGVGIKDVATNAVQEIQDQKKRRLGCGFRATSAELTSASNSLTYVITDAVPADVAALEAAHGASTAQHLLVLGDAEDRFTSLPMTLLPAPPADADAADHREGHYDNLSRLVESMLVTVPKSGSETE
jgi:hypothetical protein